MSETNWTLIAAGSAFVLLGLDLSGLIDPETIHRISLWPFLAWMFFTVRNTRNRVEKLEQDIVMRDVFQ